MGSYYINNIGIISPQNNTATDTFLSDVISYHSNVLTCQTPDFKAYITPAQLRRLSRMLRIGLTTAIMCMKDSEIKVPDGIITATGYGFLEDTEKFLREILDRNEKQVSPTFFMQGTYNALAGLVALSLKCTGYNNTYVSKGFAFENALTDGMMQLHDNADLNFLIGGYDEAAGVQHTTGLRDQHFKKEPINSLELFSNNEPGTIQGEGAAFFLISGKTIANTWCELVDLRTNFKPNEHEFNESLNSFLTDNSLHIDDIDIVVSGLSGDPDRDVLLKNMTPTMSSIPVVRFKHLCGEYCTASSFGLWVAASILRHQQIPGAIRVPGTQYGRAFTNILLINHYRGTNYSIMLLRKIV